MDSNRFMFSSEYMCKSRKKVNCLKLEGENTPVLFIYGFN